MSDTRTLPIPTAHREFTILVGGEELPREHQLSSVSIVRVANRITSARLAFVDGSAATGEFPMSSSDLLVPGAKLEVRAGTSDESLSLFQGIVVRHSVRARERSSPQLVVDCRHAAVKLTTVRRDKCFIDQSDSDIIESILSEAGLTGEVEATAAKHPQVVQFHTTDWDLLLARAEANGLLVMDRDDQLVVKRAALDGSPVCSLVFGATLLEFDAEIDARTQHASVVGVTWDPAQQALVEVDAETPAITGPGDLSSDELAEVARGERLELRHAALAETDVRAVADAAWTRSRLNKVTGRGKCEGIGSIGPGDVVTLDGLGTRFDGDVLVTGVRHEFDLVQGWKTHVQFGGLDGFGRTAAVALPGGGTPTARVAGLQIGVVVSNEDPDGEHRVRIRLPIVSTADEGLWARVASLDAGANRGFFFRPEIDDEVVVGFLDGDARCPVILGMLHSSAKAAPLSGSDANHEKLYRSRAGMEVAFDDDKKVLRLQTPAGNSITLDEDAQSLVIADQNGNRIELGSDGVTIESAKSFTVKAGTEAALESQTSFHAKAGTELKLEGAAKAELSSSATTKVAGGLVQIN